MKKQRTCATCKTPTMMLETREMEIYNSVYKYRCENCGEVVRLLPVASIGIRITVGGLALTFWWLMLSHGSGSPGTLAKVTMGIALVAYVWFWLPEIVKYRLCPADSNSEEMRLEANAPDSGWGRIIRKLEVFGLLGGLLAPILLIAGILGLAALVGYINFTFFE